MQNIGRIYTLCLLRFFTKNLGATLLRLCHWESKSLYFSIENVREKIGEILVKRVLSKMNLFSQKKYTDFLHIIECKI